MPEPLIDAVSRVIGEGPLLRRLRELVRRVRERLGQWRGGGQITRY